MKHNYSFRKRLKYGFLLCFLAITTSLHAQTTLVAGDVAFTGYNCNDNGALPNSFSFIILRSGGISSGTSITFTDNGWNPLTNALGTTEGNIVWTAGSAMAQFTEVTIGAPGSTPVLQTVTSGSAVLSGSFILSQAGDQILAYQGSSTSPTFITGIHMNSEVPSGNSTGSTYAGWDNIVTGGFAFSVNRSSMPTGLQGTVNAVMPVINPGTSGAEKDNGIFNCANASASSLTALRTNLCDATKWSLQDVVKYTLPSSCSYAIAAPAPSITGQPSNSTICAGANTTFGITASNATSYKWQISTNSGGSFSDLSAGAPYSGINTNTLTITSATGIMNGYQYRCIASGSTSPDATSNAAILTVNSAPAVTAQPNASTICAGANTTFAATVSNATTYQWQVDQGAGFGNVPATAPYSGTTSATLTITGATAGLSGYIYRVVATGACSPNATSNGAALTVNTAPAVTAQPNASTICAGANTTFAATVSNATAYQWQVDQGAGFGNVPATAPYSGTTSATLTITGATAGLSGYIYRVVATGACAPNATSNGAALTVNTAPAVTAQPNASTICAGANTTFAATVSNATTYQWQVDQGAGFGNVPATAPYSGTTSATLTITGATAGLSGYIYRVVATGACTPNATSNGAALTVNTAPAVTAQPNASTICAGANTTFAATVSNATAYQWQVDQGAGFGNIPATAPYSGTTSATLTITGATAGLSGYIYRVVATGACTPNATSNGAALTVNTAPAVTAQPNASTICAGANTTFAATVSNATTYQWQVDQGAGFGNVPATAPYSGTTSATLTITGATAGLSGYIYRVVATGACSPNATSNGAALTVNTAPAVTAQPNASTICAGANTTFAATVSNATTYQWQVDQGAGFGNVPATAPYSGTTSATLTITGATAGLSGYIYRVVATGACTPNATSNGAALTIKSIPAATATPSSTTICSGTATNIALTSTPTGASFAWTAATASGTVTGASANSGTSIAQTLTGNGVINYTVTPTLNACTGTPINVAVTVNPIPTASATPNPSNICSGNTTNIALTSTPTGATFAWTVATTSGTINGASAGSGTSIAQTLTGNGTATYTVTPTLSGCSGATYTIPVNLTAPPTAIATPSSVSICSGASTNIALSSTPTGATFNWTATTASGTVNGASAGSGTSIIQTLTGNGVTNYTVTPSFGVCSGTPVTVAVTVKPNPTATATPASTSICSGVAPNIALSSTPTGASFAWTAATASGTVSGASASSGTTIAQTLTGNGITNYTVTPTLNSCTGSPITVAVTVKPNPIVNSITPLSICSGTTTNIALASTPTGATFTWTAATSAGTVNGASAGSGTSITQTLTGDGTVDYGIIATLNGCTSSSTTTKVTVYPIPVTTTPSTATICSGTVTNIALTSTPTGSSFAWTAATSSGTVTGASANSGTSIAQTLSGDGVVNYTITPTLNGCAGSPITVAVTVNPNPIATANPNSEAICSGTTTNITLSSVPTGATFSWTTVTASGTVSGTSDDSGNLIAQGLSGNGVVNYIVTPILNACTGSPITVAVTVKAIPAIPTTGTPMNICTGTATNIPLNSNPSGADFDWTSTVISGTVTGNSATGNSSTISETLTGNGTVEYTITPTLASCQGSPAKIAVIVNPAPAITLEPASQNKCIGATVTFSTDGTDVTTYKWQEDNGSGFSDLTEAAPYSGVSTSSLTITGITGSLSNNSYRCILSGACAPEQTTQSAVLTTTDAIAPVFSNCPSDVIIEAGVYTYTAPTATDNCTNTPTVTLTAGLGSGATFPVGTTTETYTATDDAGNTVTCSFTVTATPVTSVDIETFDNQIKIYPNPVSETLYINLETSNVATYSVLLQDLSGKAVLQSVFNGSEKNFSLNIQNLAKGIYFFSISNENGKKTEKIVIE